MSPVVFFILFFGFIAVKGFVRNNNRTDSSFFFNWVDCDTNKVNALFLDFEKLSEKDTTLQIQLSDSIEKNIKFCFVRHNENKEYLAYAFYKLYGMSFKYFKWKRIDVSIRLCKEIVNHGKHIPDLIEIYKPIAKAEHLLGLINQNINNLDSALFHYQRSIKFSELVGDSLSISKSLGNIGIIQYYKGLYRESIATNLQVLVIQKKYGASLNIGLTYRNLGNAYYGLGDYLSAEKQYKNSIEVFYKNRDTINYYLSRNNLVSILIVSFQLEEARDLCFEILKNTYGEMEIELFCYRNLGKIYSELGNFTLSKSYFLMAFGLTEKVRDGRGGSELLVNVANQCYNLGDVEEAMSYYKKAFENAYQKKMDTGCFLALTNWGVNLLKTGQYTEGMSKMESARNWVGAVSVENQLGFFVNLGTAFLESGLVDSARHYLNLVKLNVSERAHPDILNAALEGLVDCDGYQHHTETLINHSELLLSNLEYRLDKAYFLLSTTEKNALVNRVRQGLAHILAAMLHTKYRNVDLEIRMASMLLKTNGVGLYTNSKLLKSLKNRGERDEISLNLLFDLYDRRAGYKLENSISFSLDSTINALEIAISKEIGIEEQTISLKTFNFDKLISTLDSEKATLVQFVLFDEFPSYVKLKSGFVSLIYNGIDRSINFYYLVSSDSLLEQFRFDEGELITHIDRIYSYSYLYNLLIEPWRSLTKNTKRIFFVTEGVLNRVNFGAIRTPDGNNLFEGLSVQRLVSPFSLLTRDFVYDLDTTFLLTGGLKYSSGKVSSSVNWSFLPGTKREIERIAGIFNYSKVKYDIITDDQGSEYVLKKEMGKYNVLHFSTHGYYFPDDQTDYLSGKPAWALTFRSSGLNRVIDPYCKGKSSALNSIMQSVDPMVRNGIVCAGVDDVQMQDSLLSSEDGYLSSLEISELDLSNCNLVVLSACETGLGDVKGSEGVYGLQRGFKLAGVRYIIMSLWKVSDIETSEFMVEFYRNRSLGISINESFTNTQLFMKSRYAPYSWAGFVLVQ